jgi:hypothetical protein
MTTGNCQMRSVVPQTLHRARDDEKVLRIRMTVKRNRDAGRDRSLQHTEVIALIFRRGQKLYRWSEEFDDQAGGGILLKTHRRFVHRQQWHQLRARPANRDQ